MFNVYACLTACPSVQPVQALLLGQKEVMVTTAAQVVGAAMEMLETEPEFSGRVVSVFDCRAISADPI